MIPEAAAPSVLEQFIQWIQIAAIVLQVVYFVLIPVVAFLALRQFKRLVDHWVGAAPESPGAGETSSATSDKDLKVDEFVD